MDFLGWFLGFLWIGPLLAMGFAYMIVYYLPLIITFFAFIGTMLFLMFYITIKILIKRFFCNNSERNTKIITISNMILNVIKTFVSAGSYLLLFCSMIWLGVKFEPSGIIFPILIITFIQLILIIILKVIKKLNAIYFIIFLLIEPYIFLYVLVGNYYSRGLLFQGI
jgi:hypothetical protein